MRTEHEKYPHIITQDPTRELVEIMSVLQGRTARARAKIEASTEQTSPFCKRKKRQNPSLRQRRKICEILPEAKYCRKPVSSVKQSIVQRTKSSPEKSNVPYSTSNTQTPTTTQTPRRLPETGSRRIMHHFPSAKSASNPKEKTNFHKPP